MGYNSAYALSDAECHVSAVPSIQDPILVIKDGAVVGYVCKSCFYGVHPHGGYDRSDCKVLLSTGHGKPEGQCCCTWRKMKEVS